MQTFDCDIIKEKYDVLSLLNQDEWRIIDGG